jgi:ABC-2 type transport system permease protein
MKGLGAMIRKEFVHVGRDRALIGFVVGLPLLLVILFGYALRLKVDHLRVGIVDHDHTFFSVQVKDKITNDGQFKLIEMESESAIEDGLRRGVIRMGLVIPKGFTENLGRNQQTSFPLFVDGTMPTLAQAAMYGARVLVEGDAFKSLILDDPDNPAPKVRELPIKMDSRVLFNPEMRDSDFFLPGTIGIVLMIVVMTLSLGLVKEKEQATIEQLLVTPLARFPLIAGKMIPYGIIAFFDFLLVSALARAMFGLPIERNLLGVLLLGALFILALLALAAALTTFAQTQLQATFLGIFVIVTSVLMSGFVFPIEAIPPWLQPVAWALPMTYFIDAIRGIMLKGATMLDHWRDFGALMVFAVGLTMVSLARFRKQLV